jgi:hypothetical protein
LRLDDPEVVRLEYTDETRLAVRKRAHKLAEGPDAREIVFAAVRDARPSRVLEVGCGETFDSANGEAAFLRHFASVDRTDARGWLVFPDRRAAQDYVDSMIRLSGEVVPDLDAPLRVRRTPVVFVARMA